MCRRLAPKVGLRREEDGQRQKICDDAMNEASFWTRFVLAVLATWRVTHLLGKEDGPADLIVRENSHPLNRSAGKLMDCFSA